MLFSGTVGMTHLERAADRIYGVDERRSARQRYGLAFALAATVGVMLIAGLAVIAADGSVGEATNGAAGSHGSGLWSFIRWPVGVTLVTVAMTIIFKVVPKPAAARLHMAALGYGGLGRRLGARDDPAYGPLLGIIARLVWGYATGVAVLFGLACAAQLEAERAGKRKLTQNA